MQYNASYKTLYVVGDAIMAINTAIAGDNAETTVTALNSEFLTVEPMDETCLQRYHDALKRAQEEKGEVNIFQITLRHCSNF